MLQHSWTLKTLRLKSLNKRTNTIWLHFYEVLKSSQIRGDRKLNAGCQRLGEEGIDSHLFNGYEVSVWEDENMSEDGRWWRLHNNVNVLDADELDT